MDEKRFAQCAASSDGASRWFGFKGILNDLASKEGSSSGSNRVKRGGSWNNNANNCTSSNRNNNNPSNENNNNGFRLVSTVSEQTGFHFDTPALRVRGDEHRFVQGRRENQELGRLGRRRQDADLLDVQGEAVRDAREDPKDVERP